MTETTISVDEAVLAATSSTFCDPSSVLFTLKTLSLHTSPSPQEPLRRRLLFNDLGNATLQTPVKHNQSEKSAEFRIEVNTLIMHRCAICSIVRASMYWLMNVPMALLLHVPVVWLWDPPPLCSCAHMRTCSITTRC